ncbi:MAG: GHMP kinase [Planctomycetes bacterium]|nr:GHMP kinase [Planctomycetota bacterium]
MSETPQKKHFVPSTMPAEGLGVLSLFHLVEAAVPAFFRPDRTIHVARAPGRLDVLGGFADYSGSLVLQLPTAEAACAAVQVRDDDLVRLWSPSEDGSRTQLLSVRLADLGLPDAPIDADEARAFFHADPRDRWAGYLLGCCLVLARARRIRFTNGAEILLHSDVPEGMGVGSSAAIEVATMRALAEAYGIPLSPRELALLCQQVENEVLGTPCGVMDQMTAVTAEADELLALRCQPCEVEGSIPVPAEVEFVGLTSGVRHTDDRRQYHDVRIGAFFGARMLADRPGWRGWLANCDIAEFRAQQSSLLPVTIGGADFLQRYGGHADPHTRIDPARDYAVRAPSAHPVEENARAERFRELLQQGPSAERHRELGDILFAAHDAYGACGLGETVTDFLVATARARRDAGAPLYGAKVSGGGRGGTVVLFGERGKVWYEALRIKKALLQETGHSGHIFRWSSPGAMSFGTVEMRPSGA